MSKKIQCFLLEGTSSALLSLRRYKSGGGCPLKHGYHDKSANITVVPWPEGNSCSVRGDDDFDHGDPRWPAACDCGYVFQAEDHWECNRDRLFQRVGDQPTKAHGVEQFTLQDAPPGAMWFADWYDHHKGPDGRTLEVRLPNGDDWIPDAPSSSGTPWQRSGTPPLVTCSPSIAAGEPGEPGYYHGFLRGGVLEPCGDSLT